MYDNSSDGLKFVLGLTDETDPYIRLHLVDAEKYGATAVYFRHFENRPSLPQIYIYEEKKDLSLTQENINTLHKRLWSSCKVPMFFMFSQNEIKIFNNMDNKNINRSEHIDVQPFEIISLASKIQKEFKAKMFDSGEFWNTKYNKEFSYKNSAYDSLLDSLEIARTELIKDNSPSLINSLLIKSMLLKYLEEKKVFEKDYWSKSLKNAESFRDVCADNESLINLFDRLSNHFNGGIFKLTDSDKDEIKKADLTEFKYFLQPNIDDKKQLRFWDLYSFKDLPIELISNIYELFLKKEDNKGVVYTPSILVNFMIDEMMPLSDSPPKSFKVIDPSCGSGIFLVGAYKRLIQWWQINHNWKTPSATVLKSLIKNNLFGIDEKGEAVEVAKFSLSLALCEVLAPKVIWNTLKFDNLSDSGNLIESDFFKVINNNNYSKIKGFDLVIGNPPFISKLDKGSPAEIINKNTLSKIKKRPTLPDNQLAYLFLEQSFKLLKKNAHICMVQPSGFLYNNKVEPFRKYIFETYNTKQVIDFTGLNNTLFRSKGSNTNVATAVIFIENKKPKINTSEVLHITVRQIFETREKIFFDLSYYDFHWLRYKDIVDNKYIWKCNLVGGSRVVNIINRLDSTRKIEEYLKEKKNNSGWYIGEGYQLNGKDKYKENHTAEYITGKPTLPAEAFEENGIVDELIYIQTETNFHRRRIQNKDIFKPPHLLIKEKLGNNKIVCEYRDDYLTFKHDTIGIYAPNNEKKELLELEKKLKENSLLYLFYLASSSAQAGVGRATTILKNDIVNLPYPEDDKYFALSKVEKYFAEDTLNYMMDWIKGTKNKLYILDEVSSSQLEDYQKVYCELLNSIYKEFKPLKIIPTEQFIVSIFYYKTKPSECLVKDTICDEDLELLINDKCNKSVMIKRVFKFYDKKIIYIIKPKQLRFWLKSIAVRDADDTFADLIDMRY